MEAIKTVNLTKSYGKARGITDLNLSVSEGEFFGFIGPNGAGKSTTIRTLLGLIRATSGTAEIMGHSISDEKQKILADTGYLPSEAFFYAGMRVREVIKLSADLRKKDCSKEAKTLCERLQLDTARKVDELSFGNRKKVGIVCALQHSPRLLILDEPTSGLDPLMQKSFFDILRERNDAGTTIFLSSHVLSEIQHNCDRAAIVREGRLITCDSVKALSKTGAKRVTVHGDYDVRESDDIRAVSRDKNSVSFLYSGDMNSLIADLSPHRITDLTIAEPELEEVFMHYYTDGGNVK